MEANKALQFYAEVTKSSFLHYGYWDEPEKVDPAAVTLADIEAAQLRYIENLAGFIPDDVDTILDVGCGIGGNAAYLMQQGYQVDALSPDRYQEEYIRDKFNGSLTFWRTRFENFEPERPYDLILQSESAAYIKISAGLQKAYVTLKDGGYLLISDYFVHHNDLADSIHLKSSHRMEKYLTVARETGFKLIREYDQTANTVVTLDVARHAYERFIVPSIAFARRTLRRKHPRWLKLIEWVVRRKMTAKETQFDLIDSEQFRRHRSYMIYLFQKNTND